VVDGVDVFYLRGITLHGERLVILLNLEKVLYEEEKEALAEAGDEIGLPA
jgi:purine-binding chemotaxis protein CheW